MNCPYCDETINAMAKFCPKCGLPLKDDATVMGAYISDGDGPNWGIIGLGAAGILIIALAIGWLSRPTSPTEAVRREPVGQFGAPATARGFQAPVYNLTPNPGYRTPTGPSMTDTRPRWAYVPPPRRPAPAAPVTAPAEPAPEAPRHVNLMAPVIQRKPPVVEVAQSSGPAVPTIPAEEVSMLSRLYNGTDAAAAYDLTPDLALNNQIVRVEADGIWVYDPVQERWALRPDAKPRRRRSSTTRQPQIDSTLVPVTPNGGTPAALTPAGGPGTIDVIPGS